MRHYAGPARGGRAAGEDSELREFGELGIRRIFGKTNDESKFYIKNDCIFKTFANK
jgi:hypothetical protein